jgi:AraC-like DNA-binding protein
MEFSSPPDLIVIGLPQYPLRRLIISELRRAYPLAPLLILRRVEIGSEPENVIRGEFILGENPNGENDLEIIRALRQLFPIKSCKHVHKTKNYNIVRDVIRIVSENYADPNLELSDVARELQLTTGQLSRILNQQVGISFRQLLRNMRLEEAKRLLALQKYSIKEVALTVGFSDSHYFARSFKAFTGLRASEYRVQDVVFG